MSDAGLEALRSLVEQDSKMTSIACDGINPQNDGFFRDAYNVFCRLDRVQIPTKDLAHLNSKKKVQLPRGIYGKLPPKTLQMRLAEYETFDNSSSTIVHPMDALMEMMTTMSNSILNKKKKDKKKFTFNGDVDVVQIFKKSLVTTSVPLSKGEGARRSGVVAGFDEDCSESLLKIFNLVGSGNEEEKDSKNKTGNKESHSNNNNNNNNNDNNNNNNNNNGGG